ncbi:hypothetical protein C0993_008691 [Termitomyces sp. T159_Od127]|nr:hypothetical protein C0993_008691 [Termitomyces sp. T159_Od127]
MHSKRSSEYPDDAFSPVRSSSSSRKPKTKRKTLDTPAETSSRKDDLRRGGSSGTSRGKMAADPGPSSESAVDRVPSPVKRAKRRNEEWLDKEGNLINRERVIEVLDNAPDYERGLEQLDSHQKALVDKLKELGEEARKVVVPGNKRKRAYRTFLGPENHKIVLPSEKKKPELVFTKKENATLKQKVKILDWHHAQGKNFKQRKTAEHWNKSYPNLCLKQPIISAWLKNEAKICQMYEDEQGLGWAGNIKW